MLTISVMKTKVFAMAIGFLLFLPWHMWASVIPHYYVNEVYLNRIVLDNEAVFAVDGIFWQVIPGWEVGDEVLICKNEILFSDPILSNDGVPVHHPMFFLKNITRDTIVMGYLKSPPQLNLLIIQAMDAVNGQVTLSDATVWDVLQIDQRFFDLWEVGDSVLIGLNIGLHRQLVDGVIFNTQHISTARVVVH